MAHELRKMTIDSHVTLPFDVTMTLVLMDDLCDDTSALYNDIDLYLFHINRTRNTQQVF